MRPSRNLILGGLGVAGALYFLLRKRERFNIVVPQGQGVPPQGPAPQNAPMAAPAGTGVEPPYKDIRRSVVAYVAGRESGRAINPGATNLNTDGVGLSYGIAQWAQKAGMLGALLKRMYAADPAYFQQVFGTPWQELLNVTNATDLNARMAPVGGVVLWQEPWVSRFKRAAEHAPFVEAQWQMAEEGPHMRGAEKIARILNAKTPRALILFFDRTNHQGVGNPVKGAEEIAAKYAGQMPPNRQLLLEFRDKMANRFRSSTPRTDGVWKQVGNEYHKFTLNGRFDTYAQIIRRTDEILNDPQISDQPITRFPEETAGDTASR